MFLEPMKTWCDWRRWVPMLAMAVVVAVSGPSGGAQAGVSQPPVPDAPDYGFEISAEIHKQKTTQIVEAIGRDKDIRIDVQVMSVAAGFVEALAALNQSSGGGGQQRGFQRTITLLDAANQSSGIFAFNLTAGSLNNQASSVSGTATNAADGDALVKAQAAVGQHNDPGEPLPGEGQAFAAVGPGGPLVQSDVGQMALFVEALNDSAGALHVNLTSGTANNQGNSMAMALGLGGGGVVLSDAALGQANSANAISEYNVQRVAYATGSINRNAGVVGANLSAGAFANQANVVAIGMAAVN